MKTMDRERFMENSINCAVEIEIREGIIYVYGTYYNDKHGYCHGKRLRNPRCIVSRIKEKSVMLEAGTKPKDPKLYMTTSPDPIHGGYDDMFEYYTMALEMTVDEFCTISDIFEEGHYLIALTDIK